MIFIKWKKIAFLFGGFSFVIVFLFNLRVNLLWTALYRGIIAFVIFFLLGIIMSLFFYFSIDVASNKLKGSQIDLKTSNQDNIDYNEIYNISNENSFKPLKFDKIESSKEEIK